MDILGKYEQGQPQTVTPVVSPTSSSEYGFFVRLVMRLSGGRIHNARQANVALLIACGVMVLIALALFFSDGSSVLPPSPPTPFQESR
ncbi:MAG: hypothetical protein HY006_02320 [Candidatus Sungbacteria bacterium]|nr:hypothetical protein [Candidatus Sungbacteria bacterium]